MPQPRHGESLDLPPGARMLLLSPDAITRRLAAIDSDPERRWLLNQPRDVRRSFVAEVVDRPDDAHAQERWMLLADERVRRSYVAEVLDAARPPAPRQP